MDLNDYQVLALRTAGSYEKDMDQLLNGVLGACGESGEAADHVKKVIFQGHTFDPEHVKNELGDILWYVAISANAVGASLNEIAQRNVDKLMIRYPNGFSAEDSIKRVDVKTD